MKTRANQSGPSAVARNQTASNTTATQNSSDTVTVGNLFKQGAVRPRRIEAAHIHQLQRVYGNVVVSRALDNLKRPIQREIEQTDTQRAVVAKVQKDAKKQSSKAKSKLVKIIKKAGYTKDDVEKLRDYIRKSEITINFNASQYIGDRPLVEVIAQGGVKNRFETGSSGGESDFAGREKVERDLFPAYRELKEDDSMEKKGERPKYAATNLAGAAGGATFQSTYGQTALVLKDNAKSAMTFTDEDTFGSGSLGTFDYFDHVILQKIKNKGDSWLHAAMKMARGEGDKTDRNLGAYMEAQIHGDVTMDDVAAIRASFNEAWGDPAGDAIRRLGGPTRPVMWYFGNNQDQLVVEPLDGPALAIFNDIFERARPVRAQWKRQAGDNFNAQYPPGDIRRQLTALWDELLTKMPPAYVDVKDAKKDSMTQYKGDRTEEGVAISELDALMAEINQIVREINAL